MGNLTVQKRSLPSTPGRHELLGCPVQCNCLCHTLGPQPPEDWDRARHAVFNHIYVAEPHKSMCRLLLNTAGKRTISTPQMVQPDSGTLPHSFPPSRLRSLSFFYGRPQLLLSKYLLLVYLCCSGLWGSWDPRSYSEYQKGGVEVVLPGSVPGAGSEHGGGTKPCQLVTHLCPVQVLAPVPVKRAVGALCLQEDAAACTPEFSVWPPSPVTHTGSVQNLCLKTLDVKKGRAEADRETEIGPWRRRRNEPLFCTKLSARYPKIPSGREEKTWPEHPVASWDSHFSLSLTLSPGSALSPAGENLTLPRLALSIRLCMMS